MPLAFDLLQACRRGRTRWLGTGPWRALPWTEVLWGLAGVALIGVLNFTTSFALALGTALRARDLSVRASRRLWPDLLKALNRNPGRFLLPPREGATLDHPVPGDPHA